MSEFWHCEYTRVSSQIQNKCLHHIRIDYNLESLNSCKLLVGASEQLAR